MAKYKVLKSVANSLAESFSSLINYAYYDYVLGVLLNHWTAGGPSHFEINLLTGEASPIFEKFPLTGTALGYQRMFQSNLRAQGSAPGLVSTAKLSISFHPLPAPLPKAIEARSASFVCSVVIIDNREKTYSHTVRGTWYPESTLQPGFIAWLRYRAYVFFWKTLGMRLPLLGELFHNPLPWQ